MTVRAPIHAEAPPVWLTRAVAISDCTRAERAAEMMAQYSGYLQVAAELYGQQSLAGSRRTSTNCGAHALSRVPAPTSWGPPPASERRLSTRIRHGPTSPQQRRYRALLMDRRKQER